MRHSQTLNYNAYHNISSTSWPPAADRWSVATQTFLLYCPTSCSHHTNSTLFVMMQFMIDHLRLHSPLYRRSREKLGRFRVQWSRIVWQMLDLSALCYLFSPYHPPSSVPVLPHVRPRSLGRIVSISLDSFSSAIVQQSKHRLFVKLGKTPY